MHRFFISPERIAGDQVALPQDVSRQLSRVLRARPGDRIVVLDGSGREHLVTLVEVAADTTRGKLLETSPGKGEPETRITLYQAVLKADRFEFVLQKGTEVGVSAFVPVICDRSVPRERAKPLSPNRYDRWRRIVKEAAEQSGRGRIPTVEAPTDFNRACTGVEGLALMPWEQEREMGMKSALAGLNGGDLKGGPVSVFVGPEGGFSADEVGRARSAGIATVSMGDRILRAETAGIVAAAAILYEAGELGR